MKTRQWYLEEAEKNRAQMYVVAENMVEYHYREAMACAAIAQAMDGMAVYELGRVHPFAVGDQFLGDLALTTPGGDVVKRQVFIRLVHDGVADPEVFLSTRPNTMATWSAPIRLQREER